MTYNVDIEETAQLNGIFQARCRETGTALRSRAPEYDMAKALVAAGLADGQMQTWRGKTPSLTYKSIHREARKPDASTRRRAE